MLPTVSVRANHNNVTDARLGVVGVCEHGLRACVRQVERRVSPGQSRRARVGSSQQCRDQGSWHHPLTAPNPPDASVSCGGCSEPNARVGAAPTTTTAIQTKNKRSLQMTAPRKHVGGHHQGRFIHIASITSSNQIRICRRQQAGWCRSTSKGERASESGRSSSDNIACCVVHVINAVSTTMDGA